METRLAQTAVAEVTDQLIKTPILENLMAESRQAQELVRVARANKLKQQIKVKEQQSLRKRIKKSFTMIVDYAKKEMSISRQLSLEEMLALCPLVKRYAQKMLVFLSSTAIIWGLSVLGGFIFSPWLFGGLFIILAMLLLKANDFGMKDEDAETWWIYLVLGSLLNPLFLAIGFGVDECNPRLFKDLNWDGQTDSHRALIEECYREILMESEKEKK